MAQAILSLSLITGQANFPLPDEQANSVVEVIKKSMANDSVFCLTVSDTSRNGSKKYTTHYFHPRNIIHFSVTIDEHPQEIPC